MKNNPAVLILLACCTLAGSGYARISASTFKSQETLTAGKIFLNQVDVVSLYLTTERIVYVPRLTPDRRVSVSMTLLGSSASKERESLKNLVLRHRNTFNKTLMERLEYHAPQLAKEFNPDEDVEFVIQTGAEQRTIATIRNGEWSWENESSSAAPASAPSETQEEASPDSCKDDCPALIKSKPGQKEKRTGP